MASSFDGWGASWAQTWDRVSNPNAMYGSALIAFDAIGTLTNGEVDQPAHSQEVVLRNVNVKTYLDRIQARSKTEPIKSKRKVKKAGRIAEKVADVLQGGGDISSPSIVAMFSEWVSVMHIQTPDTSAEVAFFEQVAYALKAIKEAEQNEEDDLIALLMV